MRAAERGWLLVLASALLMVVRAPVYLRAPSFWAEEGTFFYVHAWSHRWYETLVAAPAGYLLLYANLSAVLAALVPLVWAPLVMKLLALAAQLVPVALIASSEAPFWQGPGRRTLGVAAVIFGSLSGEIWLSTINSQTYFALTTALMLLEPPAAWGRRAVGWGALLALCGLSGPVACFLAPLFAWRAWREPGPTTIAPAVVIAACAALQAAVVLAVARFTSPLAAREQELSVPAFAFVVWMKAFILPTFGASAANWFRDLLSHATAADLTSRAARTLTPIFLALAVAVLAGLAAGARRWPRDALIGSWVLVTTLSILFAAGDKRMLLGDAENSSRYFYVPGVLVLLLLLENARSDAGRVRRVVCTVLLLVGLAGGVARYRSSVRWRPTWPSWRKEVALWDRQPRHPLAIWPPGWTIQLAPHEKP